MKTFRPWAVELRIPPGAFLVRQLDSEMTHEEAEALQTQALCDFLEWAPSARSAGRTRESLPEPSQTGQSSRTILYSESQTLARAAATGFAAAILDPNHPPTAADVERMLKAVSIIQGQK